MNRSRSRFLLLLVLPLLAGCASGAAPSASSSSHQASGVSGTAVVDVGCPVQPKPGHCKTRPLQAHLTLSKADETATSVAQVDTGADGRFRMSALPGQYRLTGTAKGVLAAARPVALRISPGKVTMVRVVFDSGVRLPG